MFDIWSSFYPLLMLLEGIEYCVYTDLLGKMHHSDIVWHSACHIQKLNQISGTWWYEHLSAWPSQWLGLADQHNVSNSKPHGSVTVVAGFLVKKVSSVGCADFLLHCWALSLCSVKLKVSEPRWGRIVNLLRQCVRCTLSPTLSYWLPNFSTTSLYITFSVFSICKASAFPDFDWAKARAFACLGLAKMVSYVG
jgi:hypothetical protein